MQKIFLAKYYPAAKAMQVRKQLQDIWKGPNESMYDYLDKFKALEQSCCNLGVPEKLIIKYLLDGLRPLDRMLLDASAGGTIMNLSPAGVRNLIAEVAENARFREETNRQEEFSRTRNVSRAENLANSMAEELKQINRAPGRQYGQAANRKSWRNDNNAPREPAQQSAPQQTQQYNYYRPPYRQWQGGYNIQNQYQHSGQNYNQMGPSNQNSSKSLEDVVKELASSTQQLARAISKIDGDIAELSK
ncbi:unnamed protein product [Rhodiola kirilowii]